MVNENDRIIDPDALRDETLSISIKGGNWNSNEQNAQSRIAMDQRIGIKNSFQGSIFFCLIVFETKYLPAWVYFYTPPKKTVDKFRYFQWQFSIRNSRLPPLMHPPNRCDKSHLLTNVTIERWGVKWSNSRSNYRKKKGKRL